MIYELINPSDPYTFKADTYEIAALTTLCMGVSYGAKPQTGDNEVPVLLFGDPEKWYKKNFNRTVEEGLKANWEKVAEALSSMLYGDFDDRSVYESAMEAITDEDKQKAFSESRHNRQSSLNDIGSYARQLGKSMMEGNVHEQNIEHNN